ncbi:MAG: ribonuclease P protein subunit [Candidatus Aenigmatarchaeota archaeon]
MNIEKIAKTEFIGMSIKVVESTNPQWVGIEGRIVDETKNMFSIDAKGKIIKIPKENCVFEFKVGKRWIKINGKVLLIRPEDRIKKRFLKI